MAKPLFQQWSRQKCRLIDFWWAGLFWRGSRFLVKKLVPFQSEFEGANVRPIPERCPQSLIFFCFLQNLQKWRRKIVNLSPCCTRKRCILICCRSKPAGRWISSGFSGTDRPFISSSLVGWCLPDRPDWLPSGVNCPCQFRKKGWIFACWNDCWSMLRRIKY